MRTRRATAVDEEHGSLRHPLRTTPPRRIGRRRPPRRWPRFTTAASTEEAPSGSIYEGEGEGEGELGRGREGPLATHLGDEAPPSELWLWADWAVVEQGEEIRRPEIRRAIVADGEGAALFAHG